ncbi:MAG: hypothetical protein AAB658_03545, partial [Chloroflexota bacterium]
NDNFAIGGERKLSRLKMAGLVLGIPVICVALAAVGYWQKVVRPPQLTRLYNEELSQAIAKFEATEWSLEAQLDPDKLLSVATSEYTDRFRSWSTPLNCSQCNEFWVATFASAEDVCVLEYSDSTRVARATIKRTGYRVDANTYEPVQKESVWQDRSTYHFVNDNGSWKISQITDYMPAAQGQADLLEVLNEHWVEIGCQ